MKVISVAMDCPFVASSLYLLPFFFKKYSTLVNLFGKFRIERN